MKAKLSDEMIAALYKCKHHNCSNYGGSWYTNTCRSVNELRVRVIYHEASCECWMHAVIRYEDSKDI
jgi:hypothetical protein